ncbi:MAG: ABC transporter permease [Clostridiaceae bacterium]|nr:ABC transporter permease [Clostridiaceae bacterium]MBW4859049.1 ABC transporter permease [Clostridiaceae bacterium]MBW4869624.1 ABC transporter permease [Clostridiaceae bacterium]
MIVLIKNNLKLFLKNIYLALGTFVFFIVVNIYLIEGMYKLSIHKDALYYLAGSQYMSMICFVFFTFISYEYLVKIKNDDLLECFSAMDKGKVKLYFSQLVVLIIIVSLITLNIMIYNYVAYFAMNLNSLAYAIHIFLSNFINIFLVSLLGVFIGAVASMYLKRFSAYFLMIVLVFLISPISEIIPSIFDMGFGINIYPIREIFDILPPNLDWFEEYLYGLPIEPYRWNLLIFWILLLLSFILLKLTNKKFKYLNFLSIILLSVSLINFHFFNKPSSIMKNNEDPEKSILFDQLYYKFNDVQREEDVNFTISAYNMNIAIDRELHNDMRIFLDEKEALNSYKFTLYRNYKIEKILNKENETLSFKRDGDYLEIYNPSNEKLEEIRILYSGYSPVFYSNSQGILLPGCFPYYPIEGYKILYSNEQSKYIPIIRNDDVKFNVSVKSNLNICSNLEKDGDNFFGNSQAMTLIGGFVNEENIGDNIYYSLFLEKLSTDKLLNVENLLEPYKNMFLGNEKIDVSNKKIFQSPPTLIYNVIDNGLVSFRDHIFVYDLSKEGLIHGFLQSTIPQDIRKIEIKTIFFEYLLYRDTILNIPEEELENNKLYESYNLFLGKVDELGEDYVLKSTYNFLRDKNDARDSITFIKDLTKEVH